MFFRLRKYDNSYGDIRLVSDNYTPEKTWNIYQPKVWQEIQEKHHAK